MVTGYKDILAPFILQMLQHVVQSNVFSFFLFLFLLQRILFLSFVFILKVQDHSLNATLLKDACYNAVSQGYGNLYTHISFSSFFVTHLIPDLQSPDPKYFIFLSLFSLFLIKKYVISS
jgi:hypothetical protein